MSPSVDLTPVAKTLARYPNVVAGWVFGSAQEGRVRPGGDVDLGVLFDKQPDLDEMADLRADLQDALHFDRVDLVVLNEAHVILRYEAVSGRPLYCRDMGRLAAFVSLTAREYEDAMVLLQDGLEMQRNIGRVTDAMRTIDQKLLDETVRRIVTALQPEAIYLYGSHAYGQPHQDSDVDLFVVVSDSALPPHRRAMAVYRALRGLFLPAEVKVATRAEFERRARWRNSIEKVVSDKGRLLYESVS